MKAKGYSLWLMPAGRVYDKLSGLVHGLARKYSTPIFDPHVTLIGEIMQGENDVLKRTEWLTSGQHSFQIMLSKVDYQDYYFRTLFIRAGKMNSLRALHSRAKKIFEMESVPDYMPHLSIMYGNFSEFLKEQIIQDIGKNQAIEFTVNSVHVFKTDGEVNAWRKIKEFPLSLDVVC